MKHTILLNCVMVTSMIAATVTGCHSKDATTAEGPMPVDVSVPEVDSITLFKTYPGYVGANATAKIVARVNGTLMSKNFESGAFVKKGQVLFTIEPTKYHDAVAQAQASLANARSSYEYASSRYAAVKKAYESDAVSQMEVVQAKSNMEQAQAAIKQAQAALSTAHTNLSYCTVRAPFDGHITSNTLDVGNYVGGEGAPTELATLYDYSSVYIEFAVEDAQYERMMSSKGDPEKESIYHKVPLTFTEPLPHDYMADLFYTSPVIDKSTGTLTLKVRLDNPYGELKPGMYVTVNLPYGNDPKAILVKDASIGTDQLGKYLYVVNDSDKIVYTPIETGGIYDDSLRVVTKGITPDARYVTTALLKVRDGMEVEPVERK